MIDPVRAAVRTTIRSVEHGDIAVLLDWECDGLAVHETPRLVLTARVIWSVTHVPSGTAIVRAARSKEQAIEIAERLLPLADWQQSALTLKDAPGLAGAVKAVLRSYS